MQDTQQSFGEHGGIILAIDGRLIWKLEPSSTESMSACNTTFQNARSFRRCLSNIELSVWPKLRKDLSNDTKNDQGV
ncbi:aaa atpase [Moniliophthora roreri]|nr:aaa atpase [Moniliophthora roreri]